MGAPRPPTTDVARRVAAAIAVAGTVFVALVVGAGAASAAPTLLSADSSGSTLVGAPSSAALQASGDSLAASVPSMRGHGDPFAGWAEPSTVSVLLAAPVAFFVGLTDTSQKSRSSRALRQLCGRGPPPGAAPVPR